MICDRRSKGLHYHANVTKRFKFVVFKREKNIKKINDDNGRKTVGVDLGLVGLRKHYKGSMTRSLSLCWWSCAADV